jgi:CHASE2 domain-containing sensor protein
MLHLRPLLRYESVLGFLSAFIAAGVAALGGFKTVETWVPSFAAGVARLNPDKHVTVVVVDDCDLQTMFPGGAGPGRISYCYEPTDSPKMPKGASACDMNNDTAKRQNAGQWHDRPTTAPPKKSLDPCDVADIIKTLENLSPAVIGLDFDTSRPDFKTLQGHHFGAKPVIWARLSSYSQRSRQHYLSDVLGGYPDVHDPYFLSALVELPPDPDGSVSEYYRAFDTNEGPKWFLPCQIAQTDPRLPPPATPEASSKPLPIRYHEPVQRIYYRYVKDQKDSIKDQAVLVGGAFRGLDEHNTPLGWLPGVEILGQIAETDIGNKPAPNRSVVTCVIFLLAVFTAAAFAATRPWWFALAAGLGAMVLSTLVFHRFFPSLDLTLGLLLALSVSLGSQIRSRYLDWKKEQETEKLIQRVKAETNRDTLEGWETW